MVALLDDTLLDYWTTYPFLLVADVALYLLLERDDFYSGPQSVSVSLPRNWVLLGRTVTFYVILHVAIILIYFLFLTFSLTYLIYVRSLFT